MGEKKTIKASIGIVICIIIIIVLAVALVMMYLQYNSDTKQNENNSKNQINTQTSNQISNVGQSQNSGNQNNINTISNENNPINVNKRASKIYEDKELVYTSYNQISNEVSYAIPSININTEEVIQINSEINDYYMPRVNEEIQNMQNGTNATMQSIKYDSYLNGNILSLIISSTFPSNTFYKVYNIDIYKGTKITNTDLLAMKNINETIFLNNLKTAYTQKFTSEYGTKDEYTNTLNSGEVKPTEQEIQEELSKYEENLNKTIDAQNYSIQTPMFINGNGQISVIASMYQMAGAEIGYKIVDTNM